jgi:hypothetical protein
MRAETTGQLSAAFEADEGDLFLGEPSDSDSQALRGLLTRSGVSAVELTRGWVQARSDREVATASVVRRGSQIVGYMIWPGLRQSRTAVVRAVVDETASGARQVARTLLTHAWKLLLLRVDLCLFISRCLAGRQPLRRLLWGSASVRAGIVTI